ncbi:RNA-directed DNA polymerase (Reverse transcriptase) [Candidatus Thiomargarita nelsonii]|uniref:RNA-directed DNA polymerase (Reverse transcriptase) n=1 Tax=Candidatus Thiomargarita nelsonii TaxID=1003181 RepID=A0A176RYS9_9GAMM|nr:RNA-directed DNA polymerase (Reverse transcriptase) [Candidatus Thiomargarita nelsonii]
MNLTYPHPWWIFQNQGNTLWGAIGPHSLIKNHEMKAIILSWDWNTINWKKVKKIVFNLQKRIYKATKSGKTSKAKSLMRLLQHSTSCILLATRTVTTDNKGKRTAGVDRQKANTPKKKMSLVKEIQDIVKNEWKGYKPLPSRRVMIPKANGKLRPLGIPTILDRALQASTKLVLEPFYEAKFESCSYGFRPGMGCHDAIEKMAANLLKKPKWVLDADIKGCFDNIDHNFLLKQIDTHWKPIVKQWLKAGYMYDNNMHQTEMGTPQGGTISPLLANIALDQMETDLIEHLRSLKGWKTRVGNTTVSTIRNQKTGKEYKYRKSLHIDIVRYADDFVVIHESKEVIEESKRFIEEWLIERGLTLSQEKTKIVHSTEGFDFLGHHIRHYTNKINGLYKIQLLHGTKTEPNRANASHVLRVEPTKDKIQKHWREISETISKHRSVTPLVLINLLQPKITGWANYYKTVHSSEAFGKLDMLLWKSLYRWAKRRHPQKGRRWVVDKYFGYHNGRNWMFTDKKANVHLKPYGKPKERVGSYVKVGYDRSYYDGDVAYWAERLSKGYSDIKPSIAKMLKKQKGKCPECNDAFTNGDLMEAHHKTFKSRGGKDKYKNLVVLHKHCHDKLHREQVKTRRKQGQFIGGGNDTREWY